MYQVEQIAELLGDQATLDLYRYTRELRLLRIAGDVVGKIKYDYKGKEYGSKEEVDTKIDQYLYPKDLNRYDTQRVKDEIAKDVYCRRPYKEGSLTPFTREDAVALAKEEDIQWRRTCGWPIPSN